MIYCVELAASGQQLHATRAKLVWLLVGSAHEGWMLIVNRDWNSKPEQARRRFFT